MDNWNENQNSNLNNNPYTQPTGNYGYQNQSTQYGNPNASTQSDPYTQNAAPKPPKKPKNPNGFGTKLAKCVAIALVFGLVAGSAFTGVTYFTGKALGINNSNGNTATNNTTSTPITQTSTGNAKDLVDVSSVVDAVIPSIVAITNTGTTTSQGFFGQSQTYESKSAGSGIIIQEDDKYLYIVTNNHVVADSDSLTVQFCDDTTVSAEIKGTDAGDDLAVIKVELSSIEADTLAAIKVATIGDSTALKVGQPTIAIGNALGYGQSTTTGIVSALGRSVTTTDSTTGASVTNNNLIQTDAAINPGNSGGALLNANGEVIGINSVKYSETSVEGIGYAIAMEDAQPIIQQLITQEKVEASEQAYLGIQGYDVSSDVAQKYNLPEGVFVYEAISGAAADQAGIKAGDVITGIDGKSVSSMEDLKDKLTYYKAGQTVKMKVCTRANNYEETEVDVTFGSKN